MSPLPFITCMEVEDRITAKLESNNNIFVKTINT
jgi:hypothetical protein